MRGASPDRIVARSGSARAGVLLGVALAACGACGGKGPARPGDVGALGRRVVAALVARDVGALRELYWTADEARDTCAVGAASAEAGAGEGALDIGEALARGLAQAEADFARCLERDWQGATLVAATGGDDRGRVMACDRADVHALADVVLTVERGGARATIELDQPTRVGDALVLTRSLRCPVPEPSCAPYFAHMVALVAAAPDASEADRARYRDDAGARAEFERACQLLTARRPAAAAMLRCALAATTYAEARRCETRAPTP